MAAKDHGGQQRPGQPRLSSQAPPRCRRRDPAPGGEAAQRFHSAQPAAHHSSPRAGHTPLSPRPGTFSGPPPAGHTHRWPLAAARRLSGNRSHSLAASRRLKGATPGERLPHRRERQAPPTRQNSQSAPSRAPRAPAQRPAAGAARSRWGPARP